MFPSWRWLRGGMMNVCSSWWHLTGPQCIIYQSIALYTINNTICHLQYASKHRIDEKQMPITHGTESEAILFFLSILFLFLDWIQTLTTILDSLKVGSQNSVYFFIQAFLFLLCYGNSSLRLRVPEKSFPHMCMCVWDRPHSVCVCPAWNLPCRPSSLELAMISPDSTSRALGSQTSPPCLVRKISMPDLMSTMTRGAQQQSARKLVGH